MKIHRNRVLLIWFIMLITVTSVKVSAKEHYIHGYPSGSGELHVEKNALYDSLGNQIQLKGISTHGLSWFPQYVNKDVFEQFRQEWDVNVIRLAMYTAESGGYCTDGDQDKLKQLIRQGVGYAAASDMYIIVDWHILSDGNPNIYIEEAMDFFDEVSEEFKDCNNVLYEICNEPNGNVSWQEIKEYAEKVIDIIRKNDKDAVIIVGTPNWSQYVDQAAIDPITGYDNIMYTLHYYAATHKEELRSKLISAVEAGLPLFVTEYGICDASGNGEIDKEQADIWVELLDTYGISYVAWNLSNKDESSAILKKDCMKISGFSAEDLSESGKWLYEMLTGEVTETIASDGEQENPVATESVYYEYKGIIQPKFSAEIKNSWESEGKIFYQYEITIHNDSEVQVKEWTLQIPFTDTLQLEDGWNGEYVVDDTKLIILSKDYNGHIMPQQQIGDVGFIVSGSKDLKIRGEE